MDVLLEPAATETVLGVAESVNEAGVGETRLLIRAWPTGDCCAAKRKILGRSWRATKLTQTLQRLQTPSNRIRGAVGEGAVEFAPHKSLTNQVRNR